MSFRSILFGKRGANLKGDVSLALEVIGARRITITIASVLLAFASTVGCGNSTLTRGKAKGLIDRAPNFATTDLIPINGIAFAKGVEDNVFVGRARQPSEEAKKYFKQVEWGRSIRLTNSVKRVVKEIDGITDGAQPGWKVVSFTWRYSDVPAYVIKYGGLQTNGTFKGMADLRLYDDGWRIETIREE